MPWHINMNILLNLYFSQLHYFYLYFDAVLTFKIKKLCSEIKLAGHNITIKYSHPSQNFYQYYQRYRNQKRDSGKLVVGRKMISNTVQQNDTHCVINYRENIVKKPANNRL